MKKLYLEVIKLMSNMKKLKYFMSYTINFLALLTRRRSEQGRRNCPQRFFRKV